MCFFVYLPRFRVVPLFIYIKKGCAPFCIFLNVIWKKLDAGRSTMVEVKSFCKTISSVQNNFLRLPFYFLMFWGGLYLSCVSMKRFIVCSNYVNSWWGFINFWLIPWLSLSSLCPEVFLFLFFPFFLSFLKFFNLYVRTL